jgi:hypothetical protein
MPKTTLHFLKLKASSQRGGALIYILIAIALLAALTGTFLNSGGQGTRTQNAFKLATELNSQSRVIRSGIQDCILRYPQGDDAITETGYIDPYPLMPSSDDAQYTSYDSGTTNFMVDIRCPGAGYTKVFGESLSGFLPPKPNLLSQWRYFNYDTPSRQGLPFEGVFFEITSDKSDPFIGESMAKVDTLYSACEVDYTIGDGTNGCFDGHQCLRFWIIRRSGGPTADGSPNECP